MKFNKERTAVRSSFEGLEQYEEAFRSGALKKVTIYPSLDRDAPGVWEKIRLEGFAWRDESSEEPLEVVGMRIRPRCLMIDELTRHLHTDQLFIRHYFRG